MKFNFKSILNPTIDPTNRDAVLGHFADGTTIKVDRYLHGWDVHLRITVNGIVWHDTDVEKDEIHQVNILRESAFTNESIKIDKLRADVRELAAMWLLSGLLPEKKVDTTETQPCYARHIYDQKQTKHA